MPGMRSYVSMRNRRNLPDPLRLTHAARLPTRDTRTQPPGTGAGANLQRPARWERD